MRPALMALSILALAGCAELRAPPPSARIPTVLGAGNADPLRDAVGQAALAYADGGRSLTNNPAAMARAAAQVELMTVEFQRDLRWAPLPSGVLFELRGARLEGRAALGIRAGADPDSVVRALAAAHMALRRDDRAAAVAALRAELFEPGGAETLALLTRPGPLPQGRIATSLARDEVERLARSRVWGLTGALDPHSGWVDPEPGRGLGIGPR
jgi:hypothetical protein